MKTTAKDRLKAALEGLGMAPDTAASVWRATFAPTAAVRTAVGGELSWTALIAELRGVIDSTRSNAARRKPEYAEAYAAYLVLLRGALETVQTVRATVMVKNPADPDGPRLNASVTDVHKRATARNARLGIDGPTCGPMWQSWIEPAAKANVAKQFEYAHAVLLGCKGAAPRPFMSSNVNTNADRAMARLRGVHQAQLKVFRDGETTHPTATTPYGALQLASLRMLERALDMWAAKRKARALHAQDAPLPVDWHHLLTADMRARLASAEKDQGSVTLDGLGSFYCAPSTHED